MIVVIMIVEDPLVEGIDKFNDRNNHFFVIQLLRLDGRCCIIIEQGAFSLTYIPQNDDKEQMSFCPKFLLTSANLNNVLLYT